MTKIVCVVGRTAGGFNKWLKRRGLRPVRAEKLADLVYRTIKAFEEKNPVEVQSVVRELCELTGARDEKTRRELAKEFAKLCDTTYIILQVIEGLDERRKEDNSSRSRVQERKKIRLRGKRARGSQRSSRHTNEDQGK